MKRRSFLYGLGGSLAALALGPQRLARFAGADPMRAPTRLLVIYKPLGTQPDYYNCAGGYGRNFTLSPILAPFADLREHMVLCEGLDVRKKLLTPGEDHGNGIVTFMTGGVTFRADASSTPLAERISIDQILANSPEVGRATPIRSLQLSADGRANNVFTGTLAYAGKGAPMPPEHRPFAAYARVFGGLADANLSLEELAQARRRKRSILDFSSNGLARIQPQLGSEERVRLDRHLQAIREVETVLDRTVGQLDLSALESRVRGVDTKRPDHLHAELGQAHIEIARAAFRCDLTRITTFAWAAGGSFVNFGKLIPGVEDLDAHYLSHGGSNKVGDEAKIHTWYNERMAELIRSLRDTEDIDGNSLLDNMLVVVFSEMRLSDSHAFDNVPIQLFGGAGGRLEGGRRLHFGHRPTNDLWLTIANQLGLDLPTFGDPERCTGELTELFSPQAADDMDRASVLSDG